MRLTSRQERCNSNVSLFDANLSSSFPSHLNTNQTDDQPRRGQ